MPTLLGDTTSQLGCAGRHPLVTPENRIFPRQGLVFVVTPSSTSVNAAPSSIAIGTRGSALAMHQAHFTADRLAATHPDLDVRIEVISSQGDIDKESPLTAIGGRGVFTSALQQALTLDRVDIAVHSSKDVPSLSAAGLAIAAFPQREDPRDVVVSRHGIGLADLPANPVVGTSSRRRAVQVKALRPDAEIIELRGNIDTRLKKAMGEPYDAVILAAAGLARMGWIDRAAELLPVDRFTPAPGQGALAIETREAPDPAFAIAAAIDEPRIRHALEVERAFLRGIGGGCTTPLGAHAVVETLHGQTQVRFFGLLARDDGEGLTRVYEEWPLESATEGAFDVARRLVQDVNPNRVFGASHVVDEQLRGMKVIVTGTPDLAERTAASVESRGGIPIMLDTIAIEPPRDPAPLEQAMDELRSGQFDLVVFTSRQGVEAVADGLAAGLSATTRCAVIGEATAEAVRTHGIEPDIIATDSRGEGMLKALRSYVSEGDRVLLPLSSRARRVLPEGLAELGAAVTHVEAYETRIIETPSSEVIALVEQGEIGAVLLASPSAVEGFVTQLGMLLPVLSGATFVAIGTMTAQKMREAGLPVHAMPEQPGADAMVDALAIGLWGAAADTHE